MDKLQTSAAWPLYLPICSFLIILVGAPIDARVDAVALVTDLTGEALIEGEGVQKPCQILSELHAGTQIQIANGAKLTVVFFGPSIEYVFPGPARVSIGPQDATVLEGPAFESHNLSLPKDTGVRPGKAYDRGGIVIRGGANRKLRLLTPKGTILELAPTFRWRPLAGKTIYELSLFDETGKLLFEGKTEDVAFKLPAAIQIEEGTAYEWQVLANTGSAKYTALAQFEVLGETQRRQLRDLRPATTASFSERVLYALLLEQKGLREAAREQWEALAKDRPADPELGRRASE